MSAGIQVRDFDQSKLKIALSSAFSAALVAMVTTPLDVVKVKMQNNLCMVGKQHLHLTSITGAALKLYPFRPECECQSTTSTMQAFLKVYRNSGFATLFNGVTKGMQMQSLNALCYWPLYEYAKHEISKHTQSHVLLPLSAALTARAFSTVVMFPLEYLRTVEQGQSKFKRLKYSTFFKQAPTGFGITFTRDLLFSALYWLMVENSRAFLKSKYLIQGKKKQDVDEKTNPSSARGPTLLINLVSGAFSGGAAALLTLPLDVIKTRKQLNRRLQDQSTLALLRRLWSDEGMSAMYAGIRPRVTKAVVANAMMLGLYELLMEKRF